MGACTYYHLGIVGATTTLVLLVLGASPARATTDTSKAEETLNVTEAEALAAQYGFTFIPRDGEPMPTRAKLQATLAALQRLNSVSNVESEQSSHQGGSRGTTSENETCKDSISSFARFYQYLTLTVGSYRGQKAYTGLTRHDVELRTWFIIPPQIGGDILQDMWMTHIRKSDGPVGFTGWYAQTKGIMHYRLLGLELEAPATFKCTVYP